MEDLRVSLSQYKEQLSVVTEALRVTQNETEHESLLTLQTDLNQLILLTQESLDSMKSKAATKSNEQNDETNNQDDEYALFMEEMSKTGAFDTSDGHDKPECSKANNCLENSIDIENELTSLLGMKCAVYHTHKWGGQPTLYNAMVSSVIPRQNGDQFQDLQVKVLFTHPTHADMLPCPFYLNGECKFNDEKCRYSHGLVVQLSELKEASDPDFESVRVGSRILLKLKPPRDEDVTLVKKTTEKYYLWHSAVVKEVDLKKKKCTAKLDNVINAGEKRRIDSDELHISFEDIFPLNNANDIDTSSGDDLSDIEYPEKKFHSLNDQASSELTIDNTLHNTPHSIGQWERHTRGIGSKLMLAMGYVPGMGLGSSGSGIVEPVEARVLPVGKSLDHCMAISEKAAGQDTLKVEQKLRRLQRKEEERNKRAYEREKEKEKRNVFNFLNKTLGDKPEDPDVKIHQCTELKQTSNKELNIEQFKITEDTKKLERDIVKLTNSLSRHISGSTGHKNITMQIIEKNKEIIALRDKEKQIIKEQAHRKNKQKMAIF